VELYFIRHGQSQNNAHWSEPGFLASPDPALTGLGREQAYLLAVFFSRQCEIVPHQGWNVQNRHGFGLTHLYTSLMERAVHTAATITRVLGVPFIAWPEIHEEGGVFSREDKSDPVGLPGKPRSYFE
jgi:2,3-bisphosphoglycerate-dependent phosphoglycerate mutase